MADDVNALADTHDPLAAEATDGEGGLAPGAVVGGRYRVVRRLGEGGMGAVYEAVHESLDRPVALKVLHADVARDGAVLERFLREARTASQLRHRNVVEVLDFGHDAGRPFLVMELLDGEPLQALVDREAPMAPAAAAALLAPVLAAVSYVHARGVVHRDLKPDNVFLARLPGEPDVVPRVLDFGIARALDRGDLALTAAGELLGTPAYMAPEQAGGAEVGPAADQYALGVMLYEMLSGQLPHEMRSFNQAIVARATQPATPLSQRAPGVAPAVERAVMRALEIDPARRHASVDALGEALADAVADRALAAPERAPPAPAVETSTPTASLRPRRAAVWAVGAVAVASALAPFAWRAGTRSPPAPTPVPAPTRSPPPAAAPEPVTFTFDFEPDAARIELDGEVLGLRRASVTRPRDGRRYQLRVTAPGHAPYTDTLVADGSARIAQRLVALDAGAPAPSPAVGGRRHGVAGRITRSFPGGP